VGAGRAERQALCAGLAGTMEDVSSPDRTAARRCGIGRVPSHPASDLDLPGAADGRITSAAGCSAAAKASIASPGRVVRLRTSLLCV